MLVVLQARNLELVLKVLVAFLLVSVSMLMRAVLHPEARRLEQTLAQKLELLVLSSPISSENCLERVRRC